jgi:hypothetical protein
MHIVCLVILSSLQWVIHVFIKVLGQMKTAKIVMFFLDLDQEMQSISFIQTFPCTDGTSHKLN